MCRHGPEGVAHGLDASPFSLRLLHSWDAPLRPPARDQQASVLPRWPVHQRVYTVAQPEKFTNTNWGETKLSATPPA